MINKLLEALDSDQRAAVTAPLGYNLCIANAGSGKTRVLVHRIAYWILQGQPEDSFMMLTFTNKAAGEMMDRIKKLLNKDSISILGGTFHSVASKLLRKYGGALGVSSKFQILDSADAAGLMGVCREKLCADHELDRKDFSSKEELSKIYSYCRNCCISIEEYNRHTFVFKNRELQLVVNELIPDYEARKKKMNTLDFDDLLLYFESLLNHPRIRDIIHNLYPNIFVDEYQDINALQNRIIHKLSSGGSLTAVGDEAQCIYGFRGSEMTFIQQFKNDYKGAGVYPIRNNYRSTDGVVNLALDIINKSPDYRDAPKVMLPTIASKTHPQLARAGDDYELTNYIYREIMQAQQTGIPYGEMAILFRTGRLAKVVEADLVSKGVPVSMNCGISFYERLHIRAVMNYLKFLDNPMNEIAFWELFETVDGIGPKTVKKMFKAFDENGCDLDKLCEIKVPARANSGMNSLLFAIRTGRHMESIVEQVDVFMSSYYKYAIRRLFQDDHEKRMDDIDILRETVSNFGTLEELLENMALNGADESKQGDKVLITTVHKAKGLEWDKVFIPYLNDGVFPHSRCDDAEEERRLLYVAVTRAKQELSLIPVRFTRFLNQNFLDPSPFLKGLKIQETNIGW